MPDPNTIPEHFELPNTAGVYNEFFTEFSGKGIEEYLETSVNKTKVRNYSKTTKDYNPNIEPLPRSKRKIWREQLREERKYNK